MQHSIKALSEASGVSMSTINKFVKLGKLPAEQVPNSSMPTGYVWMLKGDLDNLTAAIRQLSPIRRSGRNTHHDRASRIATALPASKDIFTYADVAKLMGVSTTAVGNWVRKAGIETLRNGKFGYLRRVDVERLREEHTPKVKLAAVPQVQAPRADGGDLKVLHRLEQEVIALSLFVKKFAESCGFKG